MAKDEELLEEKRAEEKRLESKLHDLREAQTKAQEALKKLEAEQEQVRVKFEAEIGEKRRARLAQLDADDEKERQGRLLALEKQCASERTARQQELQAILNEERKNFTQRLEAEQKIQETREQGLRTREEALLNQQNALSQAQLAVEQAKSALETENQRIQLREQSTERRQQNLEKELAALLEEEKKSMDATIVTIQDENDRLRRANGELWEKNARYAEMEQRFNGQDPLAVLRYLDDLSRQVETLKGELANRPRQEDLDQYKAEKARLESDFAKVSQKNNDLESERRDIDSLAAQITQLTEENTILEQKKETFKAEFSRVSAELKRIQSSYERKDEIADRIKSIADPFIKDAYPRRTEPAIEEIPWLDKLNGAIKDYGFVFPQRLLYAFHTALKTADWSAITVLAGVSGTGKSELPRLYSHFGGLNYLSLPVQPNWDSKESMLGFFNTIEGKFDAQDALRFLAQSQKENKDGYPGYKDALNIILLDEMNLAYVELYFAEFLSKLEERRGQPRNNPPKLAVKLGSGLSADYPIPMGNNVLWVGTMNQDETTKALSDKVLDRGIVINFPRPRELVGRQLKPLSSRPEPLLTVDHWESWKGNVDETFEELVTPYRQFIERVNNSMAAVGRSIGYRGWQSIEHYMANYPTVIATEKALAVAENQNNEEAKAKETANRERELKTAFEDQLVQKVMPKLRGIETGGAQNAGCLEPIKALLKKEGYTILKDFEKACKFGDGQFIWNSSDYLQDEPA